MPRLAHLFPPRFFALLGAIAFVMLPLIAFAADAVATAAAATPTVNVGWFADFAASYLAPVLGLFVSYGCGRIYLLLQAKFKIDIDAGQRATLQTAITNAAGLLIAKGVHMADGKTIAVSNPAIAQAVQYAQDAAPGALDHFGLGPDAVAQKIVAKIGVMTSPVSTSLPAASGATPATPAA